MDMALGSVGVDAGREEEELGWEDGGVSVRKSDSRVSSSGEVAFKVLADAILQVEAEGLVRDD
jgi:hypothetical protein